MISSLTPPPKNKPDNSFYAIYRDFLKQYFREFEETQTLFNGATAGLGFVTKTLDYQIGPQFRERIQTLSKSDAGAEKIKNAINTSFSLNGQNRTYKDRRNWLQREEPGFRLPIQQTPLNAGIQYCISKISGCEYAFEDGAISAYRTLETLWPDLQYQLIA